jgi:hypothetical protein
MWKIFRDGGFSMFFVVGFGLTALVSAALYAIRGKERPLGFLKGMMLATFFSVLSGTCSDFGTVFLVVGGDEETLAKRPDNAEMAKDPRRYDMLIAGLGESMSPGIMGFSLLSLSAFLLAVGKHRSQKRS